MEIISQIILALIFIFVGFIIGLLVGMVIWRGKEETSSTPDQTFRADEKKPIAVEPRSSMMVSKLNPSSKKPGSGEIPVVDTPRVSVIKPDISPDPLILYPIKDPGKKEYRSLAESVDEILQENLINSPYAGKNVRLTQGSKGEVVVWVGAVRYDDVDAIPDTAIRKLIREAAAKWERQSR